MVPSVAQLPQARTETQPNKREKALTLTAMSLGFVVVQLDVTIVNVALKHIGASFGNGVAGLQWVVNAYTIAFASLILTSGRAGDRFGARRVFVVGFGLFVLASLWCAVAPTIGLLIAGRLLQGTGAAILVPCSLALLNHAYPGDKERAGAIAIWAAGASAALAAGPVVGGLLIASLGWRSIFAVNLPLGLLGIWLTLRYAAESTTSESKEMDLPGQAAAIVVIGSLAAATIEGGSLGWTNPWVLSAYGVSLVAAVAFVVVEAKSKVPMLPLSLFRDRVFSAATGIGLLMNVGYYGLIFVLSLYFQEVNGYSALQAGLAFLPMTAVVLAANLIAGKVTGARGPRIPLVIGQALIVVGCLGLLPIVQRSSYGAMWAQLLLIGAGCGLSVPAMTSALLGTVKKEQSGIASGVLNSSRQTGSVIGVSLFGSLIAARSGFVPGFHAALWISAALTMCGCLLALRTQPAKG